MAAQPMRRKVYRVRNIPGYADRYATAQLLAQSVGGGLSLVAIHVHSLAKAADPWEHVATQTATVTFAREPDLDDKRSSRSNEWKIHVAGLRSALIVDTHFEGFTPLNDPHPTQHAYDCIAISGLASHPFGSWQPHGNDKSFMWIRDALPSCLPSIRFLTYGYDTTLINSTSFQSIPDLAGRFIFDMKSNGWVSPTSKRVLFLAHSLGGVLLKQVMVMLANSGEVETFMLGNIQGAVFFGVPSKGMVVSQLLAMTKDQPNQSLVSDLSMDSPYLLNLGLQFDGISELRKMKLFWAYETKQSPTVVKSPIDGSFSRSGPPIVLVSKDSATNGLCGSQPLLTFQIDDNHSGMVKFSQGDSRTSVVAQNLRDIIDFREGQPPLPSGLLAAPGGSGTVTATFTSPGTSPGGAIMNGPLPSETFRLVRSLINDMFNTHATLRSLQAPERDRRLEQIDAVHSHTFGWLYDKKSIGFTDWLRRGTGIFWISGKPGSGKSTLMKLIHSDKRTAQLMGTWGSQYRRVAATFFFHHRGNVLQKSFEGLLRGIISQLVEKEPGLATILRSILVQEYFDQINNERLGDLPSDILELFNRYGLKYDNEADRGVCDILRSLDSREQLLEVFSSTFSGIDQSRRESLVEALLSEQVALQKLQANDKLDEAVQDLCKKQLYFQYSEGFTDVVRSWLARVNRKARITNLLRQSGLLITTEGVEGGIRECIRKQERRDVIFRSIQRKAWTRQVLEVALSRIIAQDGFSLELTLFLDALDEYDGRPEFIAEFLTDITKTRSSRTRVRVCFSSRPWSVFIDEFGTCPGFKIHEHTEDDIQTYCVDTISAALKSISAFTDLVPEIVRRAQGVFLWVRLVLGDLTSAAKHLDSGVGNARRSKELRDVLDSLPDQLGDYYVAIVRRIPQTTRWDTYVLLECVSRAQWELDFDVAYLALQCSRGSSFDELQKQVLSQPPYPPDEFHHDIRILSGGLVEVVKKEVQTNQLIEACRRGKTADGQTIQFMHQTVKEFVQDPEFKHKILGNSASITFENGNSFLFKAYFLGSTSKYGFMDTGVAGHYGRQAEITTGRSQHAFLSGAPPSHFPGVGDSFRSTRQGKHWMTSPLTFAAFYGLDLYIRDTRTTTQKSLGPDEPFPVLIVALKEHYQPEEQIFETAKALLDCGYSPTEADIISLFDCPDHFSPNLEILFLNSCSELQDPRRHERLTDLSISSFKFTSPALTEYLLENTQTGANATDSGGRTPLDTLVKEIANGRLSYTEDTRRMIELLARHGAGLRKASRREWGRFLSRCGDDKEVIKGLGLPRWLSGFSMLLLPEVRIKPWRTVFPGNSLG